MTFWLRCGAIGDVLRWERFGYDSYHKGDIGGYVYGDHHSNFGEYEQHDAAKGGSAVDLGGL